MKKLSVFETRTAFSRAWALARDAATQFGGSARSFFVSALKEVFSTMKKVAEFVTLPAFPFCEEFNKLARAFAPSRNWNPVAKTWSMKPAEAAVLLTKFRTSAPAMQAHYEWRFEIRSPDLASAMRGKASRAATELANERRTLAAFQQAHAALAAVCS